MIDTQCCPDEDAQFEEDVYDVLSHPDIKVPSNITKAQLLRVIKIANGSCMVFSGLLTRFSCSANGYSYNGA